jgi:hypothetical protein
MPPSIPVPTSVPVPGVPAPASIPVPEVPSAADESTAGTPPAAEQAPPAYTGEVPALRIVPDLPAAPAPAQTTQNPTADHGHALLREVAFLDD